MSHAILVIEDEVVLGKNILIYLERHDFEVRLAQSAEDGLAQLHISQADIGKWL